MSPITVTFFKHLPSQIEKLESVAKCQLDLRFELGLEVSALIETATWATG